MRLCRCVYDKRFTASTTFRTLMFLNILFTLHALANMAANTSVNDTEKTHMRI